MVFFSGGEVSQHLRNPAGGVADVHYGEVAEEEVHGQLEAESSRTRTGMESGAQQGQQIGGPEQDKQPSLGLPVPGGPSRTGTHSPRSGCSPPWSRRARLPRRAEAGKGK